MSTGFATLSKGSSAFCHLMLTKMSSKAILFKGLYGLSPFLSQRLLFRLTGRRRFWPFYHVASDAPLPHIRHLYRYPNLQSFERQLDGLLRYFEAVDFPTALAQAQPQKPIMHLSFDDGLQECARLIAPILLRKGIPATFFINSAFVDNQALMFRYKASLLIERGAKYWRATDWQARFADYGLPLQDNFKDSLLRIRWPQQALLDELAEAFEVDFEAFLKSQQPYMSLAQLQNLQAQGFQLGAHSHDHPRYAEQPLDEQRRQSQKSLQFLAQKLGVEKAPFAFPFTDDGVSLAFFRGLENQGITCFGGAGIKQDEAPNSIQRFPMEQKKHIRPAATLLKAEYAYYALRRMVGKHRIYRKALP